MAAIELYTPQGAEMVSGNDLWALLLLLVHVFYGQLQHTFLQLIQCDTLYQIITA